MPTETSHLLKPGSRVVRLSDSVRLMLTCPRDLWVLYLLKFLCFSGFATILQSASLFITQVLRYSDEVTGMIFSGMGLALGVYFVLFSFLPAVLSLRWVLFISNGLGTAGYLVVILVEQAEVRVLAILTFVMMAVSINIPATKLGIKKYTLEECRSLGYSVFYVVLTISGALSSTVLDVVLSQLGKTPQGFMLCFIFGMSMMIASMVLALFLRDIDVNCEDSQESLREVLPRLCGMKEFWKYLVFMLLVVLVKTVYFHSIATLPVYMQRTIGEAAHFGYVLAINQIVFVVALPFLTGLTLYFKNYSLVTIGALISSAAPLILLHGVDYVHLVVFACVLAVGEAVFSPRIIDYTIEASRPGYEPYFLAVASLPNALSVIIAGQFSGYLLGHYCEEASESCSVVWAVVAGTGLAASLCLLALRPCIAHVFS